MKNSPFSFFAGPFVAFFLFVGTCQAQTFRIDGPKTYNLTSAVSMSIILKSQSASNQQIHVRVENNTENQITLKTNVVPLPDSSFANGSELVFNYVPKGRSTIDAQIIFFDSLATRDTVYITGRDERLHDSTRPYRVYNEKNQELKGGADDPSLYRDFKHAEGGWQYLLKISNFATSPLGIDVAFIGTANGFSIEPASVALDTFPTPGMTSSVTLSYKSTGNKYDTAILVLRPTLPSAPIDTFVFIAFDSGYSRRPIVRGDTVDFGYQIPGQSVWLNFVFKNPLDKTISVTPTRSGGTPGVNFGMDTPPTFFIPASSGQSILLSFYPPQQYGSYSQFNVSFKYATQSGDNDSVNYVFIGRTIGCFPLEPPMQMLMEPTIPGGFTDAFITITNNEPVPIRVSSVQLGGGVSSEFFSVPAAAFPINVPAQSTGKIPVRFTPTSLIEGWARCGVTLHIDSIGDDATCRALGYEVDCYTISPADTTPVPLYPDQIASLPMASEADTLTKRFTFTNNLDKPVKVMSVSVADGGHFTIISTNPATLPAEIASFESFTVDVRFDAGVNGYYTDDLIIVTEHAIQSQTFHLKALRTNGLPSSVKQVQQAPSLQIVPNPATGGQVTCIAPAGTKKIVIFDALGTVVSQKEHAAEWIWSTTSTAGALVPSGVYFIRAEGFAADNGRPFVISQKLIIER